MKHWTFQAANRAATDKTNAKSTVEARQTTSLQPRNAYLFVLLLAIFLTPLASQQARAQNSIANRIRVNESVMLDSSNPYLNNSGAASATGTLGSTAVAYFNYATGVLTLQGYNYGLIELVNSSQTYTDITISLVGTNTVTTAAQFGIQNQYNGNITITSTAAGSLTVNMTDANSSAGIAAGFIGSYPTGSVTINGNANVTVNVNANGQAYGIFGNTGVSVLGSASVTANVSTTAAGLSSGIFMGGGTSTFNTTGNIKLDLSGTADSGARALYNRSLTMTRVGTMDIIWHSSSSETNAINMTGSPNFSYNAAYFTKTYPSANSLRYTYGAVTYSVAVTTPTIANGGSHAFTGAVAGYPSVSATTFTISNTGTGAMTNLDVALSGAGAGNFALVKSSLNATLAVGSTTNFTIKPVDGLTAGTYTATVTVSDTNLGSPYTFTVSFTVSAAPTYVVAVTTPSIASGGTHSFTGAVTGYVSIPATTFTISNTGTGAMTNLNVTLSGAGAGNFALVKSSLNATLAASSTTNFTIKPNDGLSAGTYTATVTITDANLGAPYTFTVSFTVTTAINAVSVTVTAPVAGATCDIVTAVSGDAGKYSSYIVNWRTGGATGTFMAPEELFVAGQTYTVTVRFIAESGYAFPVSPTATINGATGAYVDGSSSQVLFYVTFTATGSGSPTYSVAVTSPSIASGGTHSFTGAVAGYVSVSATTFTLSNTGTGAMTNLDVALSGAGAGNFALVKSSLNATLAAGSTTNFTIKPVDGLTAGTYTATVTITDANLSPPYTFTVSFTVSAPPITSVSATITAPVDGATSNLTAISGNPGLYTAYVISWTDFMGEPVVTFEYGATYLARVRFTPTGDNTFSIPMTGAINSETAVYHTSSTSTSAEFRITFVAGAGATTLESLTAGLTPGVNKVTLAPQTPESGYAFYYSSGASHGTAPTFGMAISAISGVGVYSAPVDIPGTAGTLVWVRVYKVETTGNTIVGYGEGNASPLHTYEIGVTSPSVASGGTHTFTGAVLGYSPIAATTFTLSNTGSNAMTNLDVALSGAGAGNFALVKSSLNATLVSGGTTSFTLKPNDGLATGTYTATVSITDANLGSPYTFTVSFTVSTTDPTLETLTVGLTAGIDKVTLAPQTAVAGYTFFYSHGLAAVAAPAYGAAISGIPGASVYAAATDIAGVAGMPLYVRVYKVTSDGLTVGYGQVAATPLSDLTPNAVIAANGLKAYAANGVLYVSGLTEGVTLRVYTVLGTLVHQAAALSNSPDGGEYVLPLPGRGVYIVTDGMSVVKVSN